MKLKTATNHWNKHQSPSYHFLFNGAFKWFVQTSKTTTKLNNGKDRQTTATQTESQSQAELNTLRLPRQIGAQVLNSTHSSYQGKSVHRFWTQHTPVTKANQVLNAGCASIHNHQGWQLPFRHWTQCAPPTCARQRQWLLLWLWIQYVPLRSTGHWAQCNSSTETSKQCWRRMQHNLYSTQANCV